MRFFQFSFFIVALLKHLSLGLSQTAPLNIPSVIPGIVASQITGHLPVPVATEIPLTIGQTHPNVFYQADLSDCNKFFRYEVIHCPPGLVWNQALQRCDVVSDSNCINKSSTQGTSISPVYGIWGPPTVFSSPPVNAYPNDLDELCSKVGVAYIHYPTDCHKFIQCNGVAYVHECPANLYWNGGLNTCDHMCV